MTKKRKNKKSRRMSTNPPNNVNKYSGPLVIKKSAEQSQLSSEMLYQEVSMTTNGSGVAAPVIILSLASFDENSSFTNLFDEWRILSAVAEYHPYTTVPTATLTAGGLMVMCVDRDNNTNLSALSGGVAQGGTPHSPFQKGPRVIYRMESSDESIFLSSTSGVQAWFKIYASGLANTVTYGTIIVKAIWQFRGRV
jgi:hypothetical protein